MINFTVYKIFNKETQEVVYVGSTSKGLDHRKNQHLNHPMIHIYEHVLLNGGWDKFEFEALHEDQVTDEKDRFRCERDYFEDLQPVLNLRKPIRTKAEHEEELKRNIIRYRQENKEHIIEKTKEYREKHSEVLLAKARQYKKDNKDKIKKYFEDNREKLLKIHSENQKKYRANNPEKVKEIQKKYREKNQEKCAERSRLYKENHADYIQCECGRQYTCYNKGQHFKTKIHQNYLMSVNNIE